MTRLSLRWGWVAALGLCVLLGCGPQTTEVVGTVKYKGKTVLIGNVTLVASDGTMHAGTIDGTGKFTIPGVAPGSAKVGVTSQNPSANPEAAGRTPGRNTGGSAGGEKAKSTAPAAKAADWFPIPETVMDPNKSGLTITVEANKPVEIVIP